ARKRARRAAPAHLGAAAAAATRPARATPVPGAAELKQLESLHHDPTAPARNVDWLLLVAAGALSVLGAAMVFSTTKGAGASADTSYLGREIVFLLLSVVVLAVTALVDYRRLRELTPAVYLVTLFLLGGVLVLGTNIKGAQAWYAFGPFQLQPSEPAKIALIVTLASVLSAQRHRLDGLRLVVVLVLAGVPMGLILLQPDLGTCLVFVTVTLGMLVTAGVRVRYLVGLLLVGVVGVVAVLNSGMLADYQRDRLTVFLTGAEGASARREAYNIEQSETAISLGGVRGWGFGSGPQTQAGFVPEQETDFIFTAVGEELGFVGAAGLLVLFGVVATRTLRSAQLARDDFGALLCIGVLVMLAFQLFQNVGMTMGIMPITGIPLPFVSYGGSSLLTTWAAVGLVLNVRMRRFR
ncbi:MAG: rod shape-determining protein RodA, partial [Acidimicrobiia bacterium]|nr:rod shape-determining protein RodA [Acidimicrobiia bacterium]